MAKEKQKPYEFLSKMVLALMDADKEFTNSFFLNEFSISEKTLCKLRRGEDMCIYQYVRLIKAMLDYLNLKILLDVLLKHLRLVLSSHCDLMIAAIPHQKCGKVEPEDWSVVMKWDGVVV